MDSRAIVERTWRRWARRHGRDAEPILRIAHGRRTRETLRIAAPDLDADAEVAWLDAAELSDPEAPTAIPGAAALLRSLPPHRWTVVTSAGMELACKRLSAAGLPIPPMLVPSEAVERGKPAPDCYLLGALRLGCRPDQCVVFEDAPVGIVSGVAAGMPVVGVATTHAAGSLGEATVVVRDLTAVRAIAAGDDFLLELTP